MPSQYSLHMHALKHTYLLKPKVILWHDPYAQERKVLSRMFGSVMSMTPQDSLDPGDLLLCLQHVLGSVKKGSGGAEYAKSILATLLSFHMEVETRRFFVFFRHVKEIRGYPHPQFFFICLGRKPRTPTFISARSGR